MIVVTIEFEPIVPEDSSTEIYDQVVLSFVKNALNEWALPYVTASVRRDDE